MNKKLTPVIVILVLAAIAVGVTYWRGRVPVTTTQDQTQPVVEQGNQIAPPPVVSDTPAPVSAADWKVCRNEKYGYEVKYPSDWKIYKPGAPEARPASCDEGLITIALSPDIYQSKARLNISVLDKNELQQGVYKGSRSLDDIFSKNPDILKAWSIEKETVLDSERMVWLKLSGQRTIYVFHNDSLFEFNIYNNMDQLTIDKLLSTFKFLN